MASEIERTHVAGRAWKSYAVLYRKHNHRDRLIEVLRRRRIPFVIRNYSIMSSTVVRDLVAYLRWFAYPADNVSCARVLAIPYWDLGPRDLHRLGGRRPDDAFNRPRQANVFHCERRAGAGDRDG